MKALIISTFIVWSVALLGYQIWTPSWQRTVRRAKLTALFPCYRLFFDEPRVHALSLRDRSVDGTLTTWRSVPIQGPHRWRHALWHPEQLSHLPVSVSVKLLAFQGERTNEGAATSTARPKLAILSAHIYSFLNRRYPPPPHIESRQFKVERIASAGTRDVFEYASSFSKVRSEDMRDVV